MQLVQDVAERIGREGKRRHFVPRIMAMDAFPVSQLPEEHNVILVSSTTGQVSTGLCVLYEQTMLFEHSWQLFHVADQGEVPSNMKAFWKFLLRKALPADSLKGVTVAVFGLGDSGVLGHAWSCPSLLCTASCTCLLTRAKPSFDIAKNVQACRLPELQHCGQEA